MSYSLKKSVLNCLYNLDRAIASLFGAPPQETISSETGRAANKGNPIAEAGKDVLDKIQKDHCENAIVHANELDRADNGEEK
ncbi:MAG: hypothetical protein KGI27_09855 [Thaumarchaeota archaeon]|nr:hypothetical protein [Nitrososphaerota archaeon]